MSTIALVRKSDNVILSTRESDVLPTLVDSKPFHWKFLINTPPAYDVKRQYLTIVAPVVDATTITITYIVSDRLTKDILNDDKAAIEADVLHQEFVNAMTKKDYSAALNVLIKKGVI